MYHTNVDVISDNSFYKLENQQGGLMGIEYLGAVPLSDWAVAYSSIRRLAEVLMRADRR